MKLHKCKFFLLLFRTKIFILFLFFSTLSFSSEFSIERGTGNIFYDQLAVQDALSSFFGPKQKVISSGPLTKQQFSAQIKNTYDIEVKPEESDGVTGIKLQFRNYFYLNIYSEMGISLKKGNSKYYLPQGIKPFIEPIFINIQFEELDLSSSIVYEKKICPYISGIVKFGFSGATAKVQSKVLSDLLDVKTNQNHSSFKSVIEIGTSIGNQWKLIPTIKFSRYSNNKFSSNFITFIAYDF